MPRYDFKPIEARWQHYWEQHQTFRTDDAVSGKRKLYVLDMFPYPSGSGLHVGHPEGYTATDIVCRYSRMRGMNVLHPMGWDAFGLPAEEHAVRTGTHPRITTEQNIATFKRQLKMLGFSYDWNRELATTDPDYYRWTQWIFLQLYDTWYDPDFVWTGPDGVERRGKGRPISELPIPSEISESKSQIAMQGSTTEGTENSERNRRADRHEDEALKSGSLPSSVLSVSSVVQTAIPLEHPTDEIRRYQDKHRLAYVSEAPVNWCPALGTVLANEEIIDGKSERGGHPVVRLPLKQWMLRITAYADRLASELDDLAWPESIKFMQRNWIGRSVGAEVDFRIAGESQGFTAEGTENTKGNRSGGTTTAFQSSSNSGLSSESSVVPTAFPSEPRPDTIRIYTTRPDTLFGVTYMVLAPEHPLVDRLTTPEQKQRVDEYRQRASLKSDLDRTDLAREKTGVFTGGYAINPVNGERVPVWIADYVLISYGTGAIMAVPGHDERDYEFAKAFEIPIKCVVQPETAFAQWRNGAKESPPDPSSALRVSASLRESSSLDQELPFCEPGVAVNSGKYDGLSTSDFKSRITNDLAAAGVGREAVNYRLRDWLFSRQRYWGEPFPIWHELDTEGNPTGLMRADSAESLPVLHPHMDDFKPTGTPEPMLAKADPNWLFKTDTDGVKLKRETNSMPQWAGSCWYYLRFCDNKNGTSFIDPAKEKYWLPVDLYIGGAEHAVLHLLYSRFWHKVLFDRGHVSNPEPFQKLVNQGMILGEPDENGKAEKMSKSRGNVINPDDIVRDYGADSLRLYEMFMGPLEQVKPWQMSGVEGVYRFLGRVWRMIIDDRAETMTLAEQVQDIEPTTEQLRVLHKTIKAVTDDIERLAFNTAISRMMEFTNFMSGEAVRPASTLRTFLLLLSPFAPHIAEELWHALGGTTTLAYEPWPAYDPALLVEDTVEIPVQINGKLRAKIVLANGTDAAGLEAAARADEAVRKNLEGKTIVKVIPVPGRMINFVVK
jgi:leucyl-tRNA synthetase